MPIRCLREEGFGVTVWFFNPNIQPPEEHALRLEAMRQVAAVLDIPLLTEGISMSPAEWADVLEGETREGVRCCFCYRIRLQEAARTAARLGFDAFTSSLLYSRYQQHETIRAEAEKAAEEAGISFLYRDFRPLWQEGINASKEMGLYRQKWCGCLISRGEAEAQRERMKAERKARKATRWAI